MIGHAACFVAMGSDSGARRPNTFKTPYTIYRARSCDSYEIRPLSGSSLMAVEFISARDSGNDDPLSLRYRIAGSGSDQDRSAVGAQTARPSAAGACWSQMPLRIDQASYARVCI